mmetsp:Transcript_89337/g.139848  ORF Transcript_89337/g.139848 Transcript_89337/m.139848 type:complete len:221 (+) Transcript_89337:904-1566(+)
MRSAVISTCQYPNSGIATSVHCNGDKVRAGLWPPTAISLSSPSSSPSVRNTPKCCAAASPLLLKTSKKLNSFDKAKELRPIPKIPSKPKLLNGIVDISTAITACIVTHNGAAASVSLAFSSGSGTPTQTLSRTNSPLTVPVPKPMVTWSQFLPGITVLPSALIGTAVVEAVWLYCLCTKQASLPHSIDGRIKCPEPVSKTTLKDCGGAPDIELPTETTPE